MDTRETTIFQSFTFKNGITLRNRVAMAPITTWASNDPGTGCSFRWLWFGKCNGLCVNTLKGPFALSVAKVPELAIPEKLWTVIDTAKGWFQVID